MGAVCTEVLVALKYLHLEQSTVHRDVKAANVLLTASAQVKLADFGIATSFQDITQTVIGTPHWMAPEVQPTSPTLATTSHHRHHLSPSPTLRYPSLPLRHPCATPVQPLRQVISGAGYDARVDVWSLGISAIEMSLGSPPFYQLDAMPTMFQVVTGPSPTLPPEQLVALGSSTSAAALLSAFVARCVIKVRRSE